MKLWTICYTFGILKKKDANILLRAVYKFYFVNHGNVSSDVLIYTKALHIQTMSYYCSG